MTVVKNRKYSMYLANSEQTFNNKVTLFAKDNNYKFIFINLLL